MFQCLGVGLVWWRLDLTDAFKEAAPLYETLVKKGEKKANVLVALGNANAKALYAAEPTPKGKKKTDGNEGKAKKVSPVKWM